MRQKISHSTKMESASFGMWPRSSKITFLNLLKVCSPHCRFLNDVLLTEIISHVCKYAQILREFLAFFLYFFTGIFPTDNIS